jgi:hypothetical protein
MVQLNSAVRSRMTPWSVMPWYSSSGSSSGGSSQDAASATRARLTLSDLTSCASGSDCRKRSSTASCFAEGDASARLCRRLVIMGALASATPRSSRSSSSAAASAVHVWVRPSSADGLPCSPAPSTNHAASSISLEIPRARCMAGFGAGVMHSNLQGQPERKHHGRRQSYFRVTAGSRFRPKAK